MAAAIVACALMFIIGAARGDRIAVAVAARLNGWAWPYARASVRVAERILSIGRN